MSRVVVLAPAIQCGQASASSAIGRRDVGRQRLVGGQLGAGHVQGQRRIAGQRARRVQGGGRIGVEGQAHAVIQAVAQGQFMGADGAADLAGRNRQAQLGGNGGDGAGAQRQHGAHLRFQPGALDHGDAAHAVGRHRGRGGQHAIGRVAQHLFFHQARQGGFQAGAGQGRRFDVQHRDVGGGHQQHHAARGAHQVAQAPQGPFALLAHHAAVGHHGVAGQGRFAVGAGGQADI